MGNELEINILNIRHLFYKSYIGKKIIRPRRKGYDDVYK